jgi:integrating conjugative element protein (TIGR03758 family)
MATAAQDAAFTSGAGGVVTMGDFNLTFALIASSMILLFAAWVFISSFKAWNRGKIDLYEFLWAVVRVLIVVTIFGYYVRP